MELTLEEAGFGRDQKTLPRRRFQIEGGVVWMACVPVSGLGGAAWRKDGAGVYGGPQLGPLSPGVVSGG